MSDPIERQEVIEIIQSYHGQMPNEVNYRIWEEINELPPAQPEIIHCRDCRYSIDFYQDGCCYCKRPSKEMHYIEEGYGFYCAGAKRRTDGNGRD